MSTARLIAMTETAEALRDYWRRSPERCTPILARIGFLEWAAQTLRAIRFQRAELKAFRNEGELLAMVVAGGIT